MDNSMTPTISWPLMKLVLSNENAAQLLDGSPAHDAALKFVWAITSRTSDKDWIREVVLAFLPESYEGNTVKELDAMIGSAIEKRESDPTSQRRGTHSKSEPSMVERSLQIEALAALEFFHTEDGEAWVTLRSPSGGPISFDISSQGFRLWLGGQIYRASGKPISDRGMEDLLALMKAKALYDSKQVSVYVRYAYVAGEVWIDLGDQSGAAVRITSNGWTIESTHDVVFRRPSGMRALPHPIGDGSIDELRRITALDDDNWKRFVAFLLNCLYPLGPFMLLLVEGQQGTGKSVLAGAAKQVIDPHQLERIRLPGNEHDLVIQASHSWLLAFDNASHVRNDVSDALCALATGTSYGTRKYYTDNELRIICAKRPVMINGIGEFARRPDLLDRSITLSPSELPGPRRTESQIFGELAAALPSILGVLYDGVAHALRSFKAVELKQEFRMIDAGRWITAAEGYFGFKAGELVSAIKAGQLNTLVDVTANDPLVIALNVVIKDGPFVGMISQLYGAFQALELNRQSGIPKTPPLLSNALRRLAPAASAIGLKIELTPRSRKGREVRVWREGQDPDKQRGTWTLPDFMGRSV